MTRSSSRPKTSPSGPRAGGGSFTSSVTARSRAARRRVKEVVRFLQGNNISVYATLVGDSATWGYGYLDRIKLPLLPANNVLPKYTVATGGSLDAEFQTNGMELSFSKIANEVRTQYTIEYHTKYGRLWTAGSGASKSPCRAGRDTTSPPSRATTRPRLPRALTRRPCSGFDLLHKKIRSHP